MLKSGDKNQNKQIANKQIGEFKNINQMRDHEMIKIDLVKQMTFLDIVSFFKTDDFGFDGL